MPALEPYLGSRVDSVEAYITGAFPVRLDAAMPNTPKPEPELPEEASDPEALDRQRVLGARLRALFDHVVAEPMPEDLQALLDGLDDEPGPG